MTRQGRLISYEGEPALVFERRYPHRISRVWRAITDPDEMAQWFPSNVEGDRAPGAELLFVDDAQRAAAREAGQPTRADGPVFTGKVLSFDPPRLFVFTWGGETLRFELAADGTGTALTFIHILSHQSVAARNAAGWHMCLAALNRMLDGGDTDLDDEGFEIYHDYLQRLGPALGVPSGAGAVTWERATHVEADRVREAISRPAEIEAWAGVDGADDRLRWDIEPTEHGTRYRLTHEGIGDDAALAARWHALLIQLDMYLAAGEVIPVDPEPWVAAYGGSTGSQGPFSISS